MNSPYTGTAYAPVTASVFVDLLKQATGYATVINDPTTPVTNLEYITNNTLAVSTFERAIAQVGVPGKAEVVK